MLTKPRFLRRLLPLHGKLYQQNKSLSRIQTESLQIHIILFLPKSCDFLTFEEHSYILQKDREFPLPVFSLSKKEFSTDWQRSKKPPRQTNRTRRRTDGTLGSGLCSKSKHLAQQALLQSLRQLPKVGNCQLPLHKGGQITITSATLKK